MGFSFNNLTDVRQVEEAAEKLTSLIAATGVSEVPIPVIEVAQALGLQVRFGDLSRFGRDVRSILLDRDNIIMVSRNYHRRLIAFAVAHEIGHRYFKDLKNFTKRQSGDAPWVHIADGADDGFKPQKIRRSDWVWREIRSNYFADALLIPQSRFAEKTSVFRIIDSAAFAELAEMFDVSLSTLKIRLEQLHPLDPNRICWLPELRVNWRSVESLVRSQQEVRRYFVINRHSSTTLPCIEPAAPVETVDFSTLLRHLRKIATTAKLDVVWGGLDVLSWKGIVAAASLKKRDSNRKLAIVCSNPSQARIMAGIRFIDYVFLCGTMERMQTAQLDQLKPFISAVSADDTEFSQVVNYPYSAAYEEMAPASTIGSHGQYVLPIPLNYPGITDAAKFIRDEISENKSVVLAIGCFDILHRGHLEFLNAAKNAGDTLVVGVEEDARIRAFKEGKDGTIVRRPQNPLGDRIKTLQAFRFVDFVFTISGPVKADDPKDADRFYRRLYKALRPSMVALTEGDPLNELRKKQIKAADVKPVIVCSYVAGYSTSTKIIRILEQGAVNKEVDGPTLSYDRVIGSLEPKSTISPSQKGEDKLSVKPSQLRLNFNF